MQLTIVGAKGMLGTDLVDLCHARSIPCHALDLAELDITRPDSIAQSIPPCDWIINCAAYTNVDGAETNRQAAFAVNADGPRNLAEYAAANNMALLHLSTDYVFDGANPEPYLEDDPIHPISVYGESKLAGEQAVAASGCRHIIARTQSLFGIHGHNFIKAIMKFIDEGKVPLRVVDDQVSCPTWSVHLAEALLSLIACGQYGIVHTSSEGHCSWHTFARAIAEAVAPGTEVLPVPASTYPRPAKRPPSSILSKARYTQWTGHTFPAWQDALKGYLNLAKQTR
jgi:dTDP-4-dehydrorhamnose reductase